MFEVLSAYVRSVKCFLSSSPPELSLHLRGEMREEEVGRGQVGSSITDLSFKF